MTTLEQYHHDLQSYSDKTSVWHTEDGCYFIAVQVYTSLRFGIRGKHCVKWLAWVELVGTPNAYFHFVDDCLPKIGSAKLSDLSSEMIFSEILRKKHSFFRDLKNVAKLREKLSHAET